jgi:DNA modification methylase
MVTPYYQDDRVTLYCGDCLEVMKQIESGIIDCVVTSPPYDNLRDYNGYTWDFEALAHDLYRCCVNGGLLCWNVNDSVIDGSETLTSAKQKIYFREHVGFRIHDTMIYKKSNFSRPDDTRYHQVFEYVFVFSKGKPRCFNPIKDKRNVTHGKPCFGRHTMRERDGSMKEREKRYIAAEYGMRGNVWECKTAGQELVCQSLPHPAMMPYGLCRDLVLSWSNPGDIVLDPLCGSGTTGVACIKTNRRFIGIEISEEYCEIALKRIKEAQAQPMLDLEVA